MKILFEFDDLNPHPNVDCLPIIKKLVEKYPSIVLNFFTVPCYEGMYLYDNKEWLEELKSYVELGNVNLAVHGTRHSVLEYKNKTREEALKSLSESYSVFDIAKLPVDKVFRAPYWAISEGTIRALIDLGYTHLYSHKEYEELNNQFADKIKIVYYNWNLRDEWPKLENPLTSNIIVAHGHTSKYGNLSCGNGIWDAYYKICVFMNNNPDVEFLKVEDYE